jgi:ferredoxin-NADP reductase
MARAAVSGRLSPRPLPWLVATVRETRDETASARTLVLDVPGWPGHLPGQHVTVKLTAEDGYAAQRSYSVASASAADYLELTVQRVDDGEVSSWLAGIAEPGDQFELRGPIGGWFAWPEDDPRPLLLLAGGSGIVPLMSMIRTHEAVKSPTSVQLIYSARTPDDVIYADELARRSRSSPLIVVTYLYTRLTRWRKTPAQVTPDSRVTIPPEHAPPKHGGLFSRRPAHPAEAAAAPGLPPVSGYAGRLSADVLAKTAFPPELNPGVYACGPSGFVEAASGLLVAAGFPAASIKTERFGPN